MLPSNGEVQSCLFDVLYGLVDGVLSNVRLFEKRLDCSGDRQGIDSILFRSVLTVHIVVWFEDAIRFGSSQSRQQIGIVVVNLHRVPWWRCQEEVY